MSELKLCKDCKHFRDASLLRMEPWMCRHPENFETSPVGGWQIPKNARAIDPERQRNGGKCGQDASLFGPIPKTRSIWDRLFG